jgi:D-alanyl-D-alanine carboxypeptidase
VITPVNTDHPAPPVHAQAAYLLDADTGATLYAHNPFTHLPVMSTTKLMTALLAVEHGNLDQTVTVNNQIANDINQLSADSSIIDLKAGESYTLRQLMYGLLLASGNDAAIAIADTVGGSYSNFVAMMNQKARDMGLHDTHFENPHGLQQPNHYSSSHDLAIIGLHSLSNPIVHQISGTLNYHIDQTPQHPAHDFFNGNQLLWWYPGVDAGKPGYDAATNFVQVVSCIRNNHRLIGVTIHTIDWWTDMRNLMNWGFNTYTWVSPRDLNTPAHPIPYAALWGNFERDKRENTIPTADHGRYYIYTGYSMAGDIASYFDKNGGITSFGFPLSQPGSVGNDTLRQRFEHGTIQCNTRSKQCQKGN